MNDHISMFFFSVLSKDMFRRVPRLSLGFRVRRVELPLAQTQLRDGPRTLSTRQIPQTKPSCKTIRAKKGHHWAEISYLFGFSTFLLHHSIVHIIRRLLLVHSDYLSREASGVLFPFHYQAFTEGHECIYLSARTPAKGGGNEGDKGLRNCSIGMPACLPACLV